MGIGIRKIQTEDKRRKEARKRIEKLRKKRRTHKYGQTELKPSRRGSISCGLAVCSALLLVVIFVVSYSTRGNVNILMGFLGLFALYVAGLGLYRGIQGFKERNKNYRSCKIGIASNGVLVLIYVITFVRGLF